MLSFYYRVRLRGLVLWRNERHVNLHARKYGIKTRIIMTMMSVRCAEVKYLLSSASFIAHRFSFIICLFGSFSVKFYWYWLTEIYDTWNSCMDMEWNRLDGAESTCIAVVYALWFIYMYINGYIKATQSNDHMWSSSWFDFNQGDLCFYRADFFFARMIQFSLRHPLVSCSFSLLRAWRRCSHKQLNRRLTHFYNA